MSTKRPDQHRPATPGAQSGRRRAQEGSSSGVRRLIVGVVVLAAIAGAGYGGVQLLKGPLRSLAGPFGPMVDPPDRSARPDFQVPFACGQRWRLTTYAAHNPPDKKIDFFRLGDAPTEGVSVRASAAGQVISLPNPGGVKIYHGAGWYSMYLHMDGITVRPGQEVHRGQPLAKVGAVGTATAHLHYEQLFDADGDGRVNDQTGELVTPELDGTAYRMDPDQPAPVVASSNACTPATEPGPAA